MWPPCPHILDLSPHGSFDVLLSMQQAPVRTHASCNSDRRLVELVWWIDGTWDPGHRLQKFRVHMSWVPRPPVLRSQANCKNSVRVRSRPCPFRGRESPRPSCSNTSSTLLLPAPDPLYHPCTSSSKTLNSLASAAYCLWMLACRISKIVSSAFALRHPLLIPCW